MALRTAIYMFGLGAGAMYLLDPVQGRRRRALLENRLERVGRELEEGFERGMRDLSNRASGLMSEANARLIAEPVSDERLNERIRSKIGRLVANPRAIESVVDQGTVTLKGAVYTDEVRGLVAGVRRIAGVRQVHNHLSIHDRNEQVPELQSGQGAAEAQSSPQTPVPADRLVSAAVGGFLMLCALRRGGLRGLISAAAGATLMSRTVRPSPAGIRRERPWDQRQTPRAPLPH